ncbi:MAG: protein kinase [Fibrobacteraceae bacterium]|nr:protein kinase [Fibrobacteraceae bacterium]
MIRNLLAEFLDRASRELALRPQYSMKEYQHWFDNNPEYLHNGAVERIQLISPLTLEGTNNLYRAKFWIERPNDKKRYHQQEIVVKICKFWAPAGKNRQQRLKMLLSAFQDEIRINNLIRATNIEGVVQSFGGGLAGRHPYFKMEFIKGCALDKTFKKNLSDDEVLHRMSQVAYLANTISQLHYYQIIHKDLKPKNLLLCQDPTHPNNHKILVCDFGYAQAKMRETVNEYGGQLTPCYSAPEQAIMGENLSSSVDYFSFGVLVHEYLTGEKLFPKAMDIFAEDDYKITDRYLEHIRHGRQNAFHDSRFPEMAQWIDNMTTFDSHERMQKSENLFFVAHKLREQVNALGYRDVNTDFLWNQLEEYKRS